MPRGSALVSIDLPLSQMFAGLFIILGFLAVALLAIIMPPFQNCDEAPHFLRAEQISEGHLLGTRFGPSLSGGDVDASVPRTIASFYPFTEYNLPKAEPGMFDRADKIGWSGSTVRLSFANTAIYPPFLYMPSVVGIWVGKAAHFSVLHTVWLARVFTGFTAVLIGAAAIAFAGTVAPWLFTVLLLPMSLLEITAISQDGLMIALSAAAAVLLVRAIRGLPGPTWLLYVCMGLIVVAKPPYIPLAFLVLLPRMPRRAVQFIGLALIIVAGIGWSALAARYAMVSGIPAPALQQTIVVPATFNLPGADAKAQVKSILTHPALAAAVSVDSLKMLFHLSSEVLGFVGQRGVTEQPMPKLYKPFGYLALLVAGALSIGSGRGFAKQDRLWIAYGTLVLAATLVMVFVAEYVSFTPVGSPKVLGMQGRYFLPVVMLAGTLMGYSTSVVKDSLQRKASLAYIMLFPALSVATTLGFIMRRYYM